MRLRLLFILMLSLSACISAGETNLPLRIEGVASKAPTGQCSPSIGFTVVPTFGSNENLSGQARCVLPDDHKVAVYIYVAGWWIKPTLQDPLAPIAQDGNWTVDTTTGGLDHQATQIIAFLVPAGYNPPLLAGEQALPQALFDSAVAYSSSKRTPVVREIEFSGYSWLVKESAAFPVGPGPNYFAANEENVWIDEAGRLHLTITANDGHWYTSEVIATESLGYGTYTFTLASRVDLLDPNVVLGLFTWDDSAPEYNYREIDIEFASWGEPAGENAQYVVQPWDDLGNRYRFNLALAGEHSAHSFDWEPDRIQFTSVQGSDKLVTSWLYSGASIPPPGNENPRINLWLLGGMPPTDGENVEVVIERFEFKPSESATLITSPTPTALETSAQSSLSPWLTVTAAGSEAWGEVGPPIFCNDDYKVILYAQTDLWYVQPFANAQRNIAIKPECTWTSSTHPWNQMVAFLVRATYVSALEIEEFSCPPLNPATEPDILAADCFP